MFEKGHLLPGVWEVDSTLGEGSYGIVYRAKRSVVNRVEWAAIKHISVPANAAELNAIYSELSTRDANEVNAYLSTVKDALVLEYHQMHELQGHTNIVACNDISIIDREDSPGYDIYIRMELLSSLSNQIMDGKMDRKQTIRLGLDICRALTLLSNKGIVHRDIKPQNIFVNENGDYKLGDFGTARSIQGTSTMMSMKGTFAYMPPEIMLGKPASFTSDIYSLGLVMYRLMNGNKAPFMQPGQASTATSIESANNRRFRGEELPFPSEADETLGKIICKACAFESWDRWQNAEEMYNALCDISEGTVRQEVPIVQDKELEKARAEKEREKRRLEQEKKEKETKEQAKKKQKRKKKRIRIIGIIAACVAMLLAGLIGMQAINQSTAYKEAVQAMDAGKLEDAKEIFAKLGDYKDAAEKAIYITEEQERQKKYSEAEKLWQQEDLLGAIALYTELDDYKDAQGKLNQLRAQVTENERKAQYSQAEALESEGKYEEAIAIYAALGDYNSAGYKCADLEARIENYKEAQLHESLEEYITAENYYKAAGKYKDAEKKATEMKNRQLYEQAQTHMDNGEYKKALAIYEALSLIKFLDAEEKAKEVPYRQLYEEAMQAMNAGKLEDAKEGFAKLGNYKDAAEKTVYITKEQERQKKYSGAEKLWQQNDLLGAIAIYTELGDYKDAKEKLEQVKEQVAENERKAQYSQAESLENEGKYEEAIAIYTALGNYNSADYKCADLEAKIDNYKEAQLRESIREYASAESYYKAAGKYKDAEAKATEMKNRQLFEQAQTHMDNGEYTKAYAIYEVLSQINFLDAAEKTAYIIEEQERQKKYSEAEKLWQQDDLLGAIAIYTELGEYKEAKEKLEQVKEQVAENERKAQYSQAESLENEGKYEEAIAIYTALGNYNSAGYKRADLEAKIENYKEAQLRESMEEYATAESHYKAAGKYKDAKEKANEMKNQQLYEQAQTYMDNGEYTKAIAIYETLSQIKFLDAERKLSFSKNVASWSQHYHQAEVLLKQGNREEAVLEFMEAGEYLDAKERYQSICYSLAQERLSEGKRREAFYLFLRADEFQDSLIQARKIGDGILHSDPLYIVALDEKGYVQAEYSGTSHDIEWFTWENIEHFAKMPGVFMGIDSNGDLHLADYPWWGGTAEMAFLPENVTSIDGNYHIVWTTRDGRAFAVDYDNTNTFKELSVEAWRDVVSIKAGNALSFGLKKDGTVLLATNINDRYNVSHWRDIEAIAADSLLVGIKKDGSVVVSGDGKPNVSNWRDVVAIETVHRFVIGLKSDGTVVGAGEEGEIVGLKEWSDIVAIDVNSEFVIVLRKDGSFVTHLLTEDVLRTRSILDRMKERNVFAPSSIQTASINNNTILINAGETTHIKFTAPSTGTYIFKTNGSDDTKGKLYYNTTPTPSHKQSDDINFRGGDYNFRIEHFMTADETVYLGVSFANSNKSGSTTLQITKKTISELAKALPAEGKWGNMAIFAGDHITIGLKSDGTVVATGPNGKGQCNVSDWTDIIAVSAGIWHTVGLKSDGTVITTGDNSYGQCNVADWKDIIAISADDYYTIGLKADGTVVAAGQNRTDMSDWKDIMAISGSVGLKADGTVVGRRDAADWKDIVAISADGFGTFGLKSDGTVVATAGVAYTTPVTLEWTDIVAISAGDGFVVGLKSDGTVVTNASVYAEKFNTNEWTDIMAISAGGGFVVGLKSDGTVVASGDNWAGACNVTDWDLNANCASTSVTTSIDVFYVDQNGSELSLASATVMTGDNWVYPSYIPDGYSLASSDAVFVSVDAYGNCNPPFVTFYAVQTRPMSQEGVYGKMAISASDTHTVALKSDGTVVAVGGVYGQSNVSTWKNIVAISAAQNYTIGLKSDGTLVAVGDNDKGQCNVENWKDIIAISASYHHAVGLKSDGTVVAVGDNDEGQCNVESWKDIIAISAGGSHTVGLKSNGSVVATGDTYWKQCNVHNWTDIIAVSAGTHHTVGLKSDGTVVATGTNDSGECNVTNWKDIVAVSAGTYRTVGLKSDGTVITVGTNNLNEFATMTNWKDIVAVSAGGKYAVGLKSNGQVVAVGDKSYSNNVVNNWSLFVKESKH